MSNLPLRPFIKNDEKIIFGICVLAICSFQVEREIVYILPFLCDRHNSNKTFFSDGMGYLLLLRMMNFFLFGMCLDNM